jgi:hypothetical protein
VTRSRSTASSTRSGENRSSVTTRPPRSSASNASRKPNTCAIGRCSRCTSSAPGRNPSAKSCILAQCAARLSTIAFGSPVVPEVRNSTAGSSGAWKSSGTSPPPDSSSAWSERWRPGSAPCTITVVRGQSRTTGSSGASALSGSTPRPGSNSSAEAPRRVASRASSGPVRSLSAPTWIAPRCQAAAIAITCSGRLRSWQSTRAPRPIPRRR